MSSANRKDVFKKNLEKLTAARPQFEVELYSTLDRDGRKWLTRIVETGLDRTNRNSLVLCQRCSDGCYP